MKKFLTLLGILFIIFVLIIVYDNYKVLSIPKLDIQEDRIKIDNIYIYGTHLNIEGNINSNDNYELVLYDGDVIVYELNKFDNRFNISDYVNNGIYLDDIPRGYYYLFLRTKNVDNDEYKYFALNNTTEYDDIVYYTMSKYDNKITIKNDNKYSTMTMDVSKNKDKNVYDIVLDPGHGGMDCGANKNGYAETDFTMNIAVKVKTKLEEYGFRVKLTHEEGQLSKEEKLPEYGVNGRAVIPREVNAKYVFSIHLNSSYRSNVSGLEIYTAKAINYDFAKLLAENIVNSTGISYSNNKINKVFDGIYTRNFTEDDVKNSLKEYEDKNWNPYEVSTKSNYYYMIRETGGIITGAYVDDRNSEIPANPYTKSNIGSEAYILELGYISNKKDLNKIKNNIDNYALSIADSINDLYSPNNG